MHSEVFVIGYIAELIGNDGFLIGTDRLSGVADMIPVKINGVKKLQKRFKVGHVVAITGTYRSENKDSKLLLFVEADAADIVKVDTNHYHENCIKLNGVICRKPVFRKTPNEREIADILLAINHSDDRSSYIPCIAWGVNAHKAAALIVGSVITVSGRIQSREYKKTIRGVNEIKVAFEVSIGNLVAEGDD